MNTHLQTHLEHKMIAEWVAERIDQEFDSEVEKSEFAEAFLELESRLLDRAIAKVKRRAGKEPGFFGKVFSLVICGLLLYGAFRGLSAAGEWAYQEVVAWITQ